MQIVFYCRLRLTAISTRLLAILPLPCCLCQNMFSWKETNLKMRTHTEIVYLLAATVYWIIVMLLNCEDGRSDFPASSQLGGGEGVRISVSGLWQHTPHPDRVKNCCKNSSYAKKQEESGEVCFFLLMGFKAMTANTFTTRRVYNPRKIHPNIWSNISFWYRCSINYVHYSDNYANSTAFLSRSSFSLTKISQTYSLVWGSQSLMKWLSWPPRIKLIRPRME